MLHDNPTTLVSTKRRPLSRPTLAYRYGLWLFVAVGSGLFVGWFFPDDGPAQLPLPALCLALFGFGLWLAVLNKLNRCSAGWALDTLFGIFMSAALLKWAVLAAMALNARFG